MNRLEELLLLWQDQSMGESELAELKQLLAEPESRARLAEDLMMTGVLVEALQLKPAAPMRQPRFRRRRWGWAAAGAAAAAAVLIAVLLAPDRRSPHGSAPFAEVEQVQGETFVVDKERSVPALVGQQLTPGSGIRTEGRDSEAIVKLEDAIRLKLSGDTTVFTSALDEDGARGTRLAFERGNLLVEAANARHGDLTVETPMGMAIAGSEETAMQFSDASGVVVVRGVIDFIHKSSGKKVRIKHGEYLAATADGDVYAAQLFSGESNVWTRFPNRGFGVNSLPYTITFAPDEDRLAAVARAGGHSGVRFGAIGAELDEAPGGSCVAFSPDGKHFATSDFSKIMIYDAHSAAQVRVLNNPKERARIGCLAFSPDGNRLAVGRGGHHEVGQVELWDLRTGKLLSNVRGHAAGVTCLAFAPNGQHLVSGSYDKTAILWRPATGEFQDTLLLRQVVWALAFSPDSRTLALATGAGDFRLREPGNIKLWDIEANRLRADLHGHVRSVTSVVFAPDGHSLISGSADTTVRLWDLDTYREYGMLKGHKAAIGFEAIGVALSPDGDWLATVSYDHTVKLWKTTWLRKKDTVSLAACAWPLHDLPAASTPDPG